MPSGSLDSLLLHMIWPLGPRKLSFFELIASLLMPGEMGRSTEVLQLGDLARGQVEPETCSRLPNGLKLTSFRST